MTDVLSPALPSSVTAGSPEELDHSLHHLVQHNRTTPPYDEQSRSDPASTMAHARQDPYATHYGHRDPREVGLGIEYDDMSGTGPVYYDAGYSHSSSPYVQASPLTPHSTVSDTGVRTRSGRKVGPSNPTSHSRTPSKTRAGKATPKNMKAAKSDKLKAPKLTEPISLLTKDMNIPVKDMEAWVHRSVEVRLKEVEDRKGYVTRPMNSFMLYRSAYAERLKQWGLHNNHQVVSSMAGESWPLEPPEIREHYNELSKLERFNHQDAHPNYKFSPSKNAASKKRKVGDFESEVEEDLTDLDDPDAEWGAGRRQRSKRQRQLDDPLVRMHSPFAQHTLVSNQPMWQTNDGKPLPQAIGGPYMDHRYYQHMVYPGYGMPIMEDPRMHQMGHHGMPYPVPPHRSLVGMPGGQHHELIQSMSTASAQLPSRDMRLDPSLMGYDTGFIDSVGPGYETGPQEYSVPADFLGTGQDEWEVDPSLQTLETGTEFDKWIDDETQQS